MNNTRSYTKSHTKSSFLDALSLSGNAMSTLLSRYTSPPPQTFRDHDLDELEPRPDDTLLSMDYDGHRMRSGNSTAGSDPLDSSPDDSTWASSRSRSRGKSKDKGKGKAVALAYQGKPHRRPSFIPPIPRDITEGLNAEAPSDPTFTPASEKSLIDSIFPRRIRAEEPPGRQRIQVDDTFGEFARRDRQMQKELQRLLDAQENAVEQRLGGSSVDRGRDEAVPPKTKKRPGSLSSRSVSFQDEPRSQSHVVPVRQPRVKPLTLAQTRSRIMGVMRTLADLKAEEDAYIATALAERKAGLSKLGTLRTQKEQIQNDMLEIEHDQGDDLTGSIRAMERELHSVSNQVEEYRRLLRRAEQTQATLKRRLEEAHSEAESRLSGYRGALRECEAGIQELVRRPGVRVLDLEGLEPPADPDHQPEKSNDDKDAETANQQQQQQQQNHLTGFDFFRFRPERRTVAMACDWWEGEVSTLERRRAVVERERDALEDGERVWAEVIDTIQRYEEQLTGALNSSEQQQQQQRQKQSSDEKDAAKGPAELMRRQWDLLLDVIRKLERARGYAEDRGWNFLVAAIAAESAVYYDAREVLRQMLGSLGMSPPPDAAASSTDYSARDDALGVRLVDMDGDGDGDDRVTSGQVGASGRLHPADDELSGSVIRRWEDPDHDSSHQQQQLVTDSRKPSDEPPSDLLVSGIQQQHPGESRNNNGDDSAAETEHDTDDNEVPAGLLNEAPTEAMTPDHRLHRRDDSNEVPPEFLSLHAGDRA